MATTYLYNIINKVVTPHPEINSWHDFVKLFMSHSDKGIFAKRYKNTILVITFLFANRCKIQDNQKICDGICEGLKALIDCYQSNPASSTQKTKCHCVTYKFWKWQKTKLKFE